MNHICFDGLQAPRAAAEGWSRLNHWSQNETRQSLIIDFDLQAKVEGKARGEKAAEKVVEKVGKAVS